MLSQKMQNALNEHLNQEIYSSKLYLSMSGHLEAENLKGMAHWMRVQFQEEQLHMTRFFDFILARGGRIRIDPTEAPESEWPSLLAVFEDAYKHECDISQQINRLVDVSIAESDHAANTFLQWFVTEQVEEESAVLEIVGKLKLAQDHAGALFMIDRELSDRTFGTGE